MTEAFQCDRCDIFHTGKPFGIVKLKSREGTISAELCDVCYEAFREELGTDEQ